MKTASFSAPWRGSSAEAYLTRFADDFVVCFQYKRDAERLDRILTKRMGKFGLELAREKTRMLLFGRFARGQMAEYGKKPETFEFLGFKHVCGVDRNGKAAVVRIPSTKSCRKFLDRIHECLRRHIREGGSKVMRPGTFDLLGFTHDWVKSRWGNWVVGQKTASNGFTRALARVAQWCRENLHQSVRWQWRILTQKIRGHYGYYGITGNFRAIDRFMQEVRRVWRKWLTRRSNRAHMTWERMEKLLERYPLPRPRIMVNSRFA
ncbi:reverse transcriptase domain-containing protein [Polyangium mundeleinium]|uniref:Reverse transcriptase domain-containing protein n=1 Tax=Polyangium mundeleinium TaxID=2995306 RepID=A0ABT5F010_9BACT|nr:reverse transcriptase domain-containing protein [Polyangium mundeleinium]MDC0747405.1 reverse transcriptase domain-containing protein [Polyangium mundeleinium]